MPASPPIRVACCLALLGALGAGCDGPTSASPPRGRDATAPAAPTAPREKPAEQTAEEPLAKPPTTAPTAAGGDTAPRPEPGRTLDQTFDDLVFDIQPDGPYDRSMLTDQVRAMVGRRVRIRGYMLPTAQKRGLREFVLVRDNMECCFGPGAALYDCILVQMAPGKTAEFEVLPVVVEGEFRVEEFYLSGAGRPGERPLAVFRMRGERVR